MKYSYIGGVLGVVSIAVIGWVVFGGGWDRMATQYGDSRISITSEFVNYARNAQGVLYEPVGEGEYPGVVMIHEWWGLTDEIQNTAEQLAREGYRVLAVDLYNGVVATTTDQARMLRASLVQDESVEKMQQAVAFLRQKGSNTIGSLGWCFGGGQSLELALSGEKLDATVIYYGTLVTSTARLANISWPILGIFGAEDTSIPVAHVMEFDSALDGVGIEHAIHVYPGVGHAFANPSGQGYSPDETADAWSKTLEFLGANLKK